jgi:hypothetical protein
MFLNFVVLAILCMCAFRKLWPGGLNALKMGAIKWKNVATVQTVVSCESCPHVWPQLLLLSVPIVLPNLQEEVE